MSPGCGCGGAHTGPADPGYARRPGSAVGSRERARPAPGSAGSSAAASRGDPAGVAGPDPAGAAVDDQDAVVAGPIIGLNPQDGLFLKAEHLTLIQNYAAALSSALGIAVGTGVVYGYGLAITDQGLTASAGLAVARDGGLLQSGSPLRHRLDDAHLPGLDPDGFWVVEVAAEEDTAGQENAYGAICADPCDGVNAIQPLRRFLVRLKLRADTLRGLDDHLGADRRNWLASAYFERERRAALPWLVPGDRPPGQPGSVPQLAGRDWVEPGAARDRLAVPVGVLFRDHDQLQLDTWTARREIDGPPGITRWSGHLARRSWPVFLAQLLQFADQVRALGDKICEGTVSRELVVDPRTEILDKFFADHPRDDPAGRLHVIQELRSRLLQAPSPYLVTSGGRTLPELGLGELPPAGYLGCMNEADPRAHIGRLFDDRVKLRFCDVRADYVAGAVQAAQHLDRIPLDPRADPQPQVDILLPSLEADLDGTRTGESGYRWIAFVRHSSALCDEAPPPPDPKIDAVDMLMSNQAVDDYKELAEGRPPDRAIELGELQFPADSAELPIGAAKPTELNGMDVVGIVAAAANSAVKQLALKRAGVVASAWNLGDIEPTFVTHSAFDKLLMVVFVRGNI